MPWCSDCDRYLTQPSVTPDGRCPRCGASVDGGVARAPVPVPDDEETLPLPWHFKMLVGALALYLGWRAFQGVEWLVHQL